MISDIDNCHSGITVLREMFSFKTLITILILTNTSIEKTDLERITN